MVQTSESLVERFFRDLTTTRLRRGVFTGVQDLELALHHYVRLHNQSPKPFIWTKTATDILQKVTRARQATNKYQSEWRTTLEQPGEDEIGDLL